MTGQEFFDQLISYTKDVCERLRIRWDARGKRNWRGWDEGHPTGWLEHFTASNAAVTPRRRIGRIPVLLKRFARNSGSPGVHFVVWDDLVPEFADLRAKYEIFESLRCDVFCWGLDVAFFHGNSANGYALGVENRNIGRLKKREDGSFGWGKGGKIDYVGREPVAIRGFYCEPFTLAQIDANIQLIRNARELFPIRRFKVLGHENIISNRTDPSPHFPLQLVRELGFNDHPYLAYIQSMFKDDDEFFKRYDEWIEDDLDDLVMDSDESDLFARLGEVDECRYEADEGLYGEDGEVTVLDIQEAKKALIQLGYWPLGENSLLINSENSLEFIWSLKRFQNRWVVRKNGQWVCQLRDSGIVDRATATKLNEMLRQWRHID